MIHGPPVSLGWNPSPPHPRIAYCVFRNSIGTFLHAIMQQQIVMQVSSRWFQSNSIPTAPVQLL